MNRQLAYTILGGAAASILASVLYEWWIAPAIRRRVARESSPSSYTTV